STWNILVERRKIPMVLEEFLKNFFQGIKIEEIPSDDSDDDIDPYIMVLVRSRSRRKKISYLINGAEWVEDFNILIKGQFKDEWSLESEVTKKVEEYFEGLGYEKTFIGWGIGAVAKSMKNKKYRVDTVITGILGGLSQQSICKITTHIRKL
ncbi:MAG: hypothetical protein Q8Q25_01465, partial [bacterium]|nr:hypothetical protein [bacterium]